VAAFPGSAPILVDSAGCGAALKDFGHLLGREGEAFAARVFDIHEWIANRAGDLPPSQVERNRDRTGARNVGQNLRIAVQDPCHLRHVQHAEIPVRTVLSRYGEVVELADEGRCCGAGGAYSALQPDLAGAVRTQKVAVIAAARADVVASANPGCAMWLSAAGVPVRHPMEIVAEMAGLIPAPSH
jgi:glycolate oxidase iron-sulfur subunit